MVQRDEMYTYLDWRCKGMHNRPDIEGKGFLFHASINNI